MCFDKTFTNRQSKTCAANLPSQAVIDPNKTVEYLVLQLLRDTGAMIANG